MLSGSVRLTHVGLWFVVFLLVVALAATNTGNNALYMVLAAMLATLFVSLVLGRLNLVRIEGSFASPPEVFAGTPVHLPLLVRSRSFLLPRWLLQVTLTSLDVADLLTHLPRWRRGSAPHRAHVRLAAERRGPLRIDSVALSTLFPFGFLRITRRLRAPIEVVVYPRLLENPLPEAGVRATGDDETLERLGFGCDLLGVRELRPGDDPRAIHWKQTARLGRPMFKQRAAEESRRVSIVIDNAGPLPDQASRERFERLVSVAATAAVALLQQGCEVELVSHSERVPFGTGAAQRTALLVALARIAPIAGRPGPLRGGPRALELALEDKAA